MNRIGMASAAVAVLCAATGAKAQTGAPVATELFVSGLSLPLEMIQHPNNPSVQFIVQQGGTIRVVQNGVLGGDFINVASFIGNSTGERGLLGLAFDPDYGTGVGDCNDCLYLNHTGTNGATNVVRYRHQPGNSLVANTATREVLFTVAQPFSNHNGGHLEIGPDGMLYIGMGDGGSGGDPFENAQNLNVQLGKILRIDVSSAPGFTIPLDNPFVGAPGNDSIWAYGVRNPWKFTFDTGSCGTNALTIGDVGQDSREEIDYEPAGAGGRNYGWDCWEGNLCQTNDVGCNCAAPGFTSPLHVVNQPTAQSITGGYVYRGASMPHNRGRYFFGDFVTGIVRSLGLSLNQNGEATVVNEVNHTTTAGGFNISSFARDAAGELYVINYFGGSVRKIVGQFKSADTNLDGVVNGSDLAALLSQWLDASCGLADLNNDGIVNGSDLASMLAQWG